MLPLSAGQAHTGRRSMNYWAVIRVAFGHRVRGAIEWDSARQATAKRWAAMGGDAEEMLDLAYARRGDGAFGSGQRPRQRGAKQGRGSTRRASAPAPTPACAPAARSSRHGSKGSSCGKAGLLRRRPYHRSCCAAPSGTRTIAPASIHNTTRQTRAAPPVPSHSPRKQTRARGYGRLVTRQWFASH